MSTPNNWFSYEYFIIDMSKITSIEYQNNNLLISVEGVTRRITTELNFKGAQEILKAFKEYKGIKGD
jgi:hypothetical protein